MLDRNMEISFQEIQMPSFIKPQSFFLDNGIKVHLLEAGEKELCRVDLVFHAGSKMQNKPLQAILCNALLFEGTKDLKAETIHEQIDFYGAYTQLDINYDRSIVTLYTLNKYFNKVFPIFINAIKNAVFPEQLFRVVLEQKKQRFIVNSDKVEFVAKNTFFNSIFKDHSYGSSICISDFDNILKQDIINFHNHYYKNASPEVYIAGMMPAKGDLILNQFLGSWNMNIPFPINQHIPSIINDKIHISKDGALQSAIRIGRVTFNSHHKDYHQLKFLSVVLGGYFGSRLMKNIREDKGLTYGIGASCVQQEESGYFCISTEVKGEATQLALEQIYYELRQLREEPISSKELDLVKRYVMGQILKSADGPFAQVSLLKNLHMHGLGFEFYKEYEMMLDQLDSHRLQYLANKYLKKEDLCEIVVGNTSL